MIKEKYIERETETPPVQDEISEREQAKISAGTEGEESGYGEITVEMSIFDENDFTGSEIKLVRKRKTSLIAWWFSAFGRIRRSRTMYLPLERIYCDDERRRDAVESAKLAESIRIRGLIEPIIVYKAGKMRFGLIDGELRLNALKMLGCSHAECLVLACDRSTGELLRKINLLEEGAPGVLEQTVRAINCRLKSSEIKEIEEIIPRTKIGACTLPEYDESQRPGNSEIERLRLMADDRHLIGIISVKDKQFREYCIEMAERAHVDYIESLRAIVEDKDRRFRRADRTVVKDVKLVFNSVESVLYRFKSGGMAYLTERSEDAEYYSLLIKVRKKGSDPVKIDHDKALADTYDHNECGNEELSGAIQVRFDC